MTGTHHESRPIKQRRLVSRKWPKTLAVWAGRLLILAGVIAATVNYAGGYLRLWHRDGYMIECIECNEFSGPVWAGQLKGADGSIFHFSADGRPEYLYFRRGYYGSGTPRQREADVLITTDPDPGGDWYLQRELRSMGQGLSNRKHASDPEAGLLRLYYRPFALFAANWIVEVEVLRNGHPPADTSGM